VAKFDTMIRKFLFSLLLVTASTTAHAQKCTPDFSLVKPGYKPDTLQHAKSWSYYEQVISVLSVRDTSRIVSMVKIAIKVDSIKIKNVIGMPAGFSYQCLHPRCVFVWDTVRCVKLFGTSNTPGVYPIKIAVVAYAKIGTAPITQPDTIKQFSLTIDGNANTMTLEKGETWKLYPVPAHDQVYVLGTANKLMVYNTCGVLQKLTVQTSAESQILDISTLPLGIYWVTDGVVTRKLSKN
jgi:hypothetical protein